MRSAYLLLMVAACGRAGDAEVHANISLTQGLIASDVHSLELTIAENTGTDGTPFTCAKLGSDWIVARSDAQIRDDRLLTPSGTNISNIAKGIALVVVLDAYSSANGLGNRIAHGCLDGVTIAGGQTKSISITLSPLK